MTAATQTMTSPSGSPEEATMTGMGKHSKLTRGQHILAAFIVILAAALTPVFFTVMFVSVTHLLTGSFGAWAWTVPVATEISFTLLYLLYLLLVWLGRAPGWLWLAPFPFAAASLWLNVYSARGNLPGMVGHGVVTVAFFIPLLALKSAVRRLSVSDEERLRSAAVEDAIAHARDILRAADPWWRFRAPVLLRRQIRSRRLPAAVADAISEGVMFGGAAKWEPAVEEWITRSLVLPEGVSAQLAAAREAASRSMPQAEPVACPEPTPGPVPEPALRPRPKRAPEHAPKVALKLTAAKSRSMPAERVAEHVSAMLEEYGDVSLNRVKTDLSVGTEKAQRALEIARRNRTVVPMERRA
jgi:hypothetical protein